MLRAPPQPLPLDAAEPTAAAARCRNCGAIIGGRYCAACGQEERDPDPSVRELLAEFVAEQFGVDGKLPATFRRLLRRPGQLTLDYLAGRRAAYPSPLRVYLICSVVFFAVAAVVREPRRVVREASARQVRQADDVEGSELVRARIASVRRSPSALTRRAAANLEKQLAHLPELGQWKAAALPKLMFVLVPVFAALTGLVIRGRARFPAHLAFALHAHAFAFVVLLLYEAGLALDRVWTVVAGTTLSWALLLAYLILALRRTYGLGAGAALARGAAIAIA